jgi:hypothetical protein
MGYKVEIVGIEALLLALVSRGNERQANVPVFEAPNLSSGIVHNDLCLCQ